MDGVTTPESHNIKCPQNRCLAVLLCLEHLDQHVHLLYRWGRQWCSAQYALRWGHSDVQLINQYDMVVSAFSERILIWLNWKWTNALTPSHHSSWFFSRRSTHWSILNSLTPVISSRSLPCNTFVRVKILKLTMSLDHGHVAWPSLQKNSPSNKFTVKHHV